jgi:hypothetical protein
MTTIKELLAEHGSPENIPNEELYRFIAQSQTQTDLRRVVSGYAPSGSSEFCPKTPSIDQLRKIFVTDPSFSASMPAEFRAEMVSLLFPEYAEPSVSA